MNLLTVEICKNNNKKTRQWNPKILTVNLERSFFTLLVFSCFKCQRGKDEHCIVLTTRGWRCTIPFRAVIKPAHHSITDILQLTPHSPNTIAFVRGFPTDCAAAAIRLALVPVDGRWRRPASRRIREAMGQMARTHAMGQMARTDALLIRSIIDGGEDGAGIGHRC